MYKYIFLDLDGTLTDPGIGITNSVMYALKKYGIEETDRTKLYKFIGPPLNESFMSFYNFSDEKAKEAVEYYREYFRDKGIFENELYKEVPDALKTLKEQGRSLVVATSKPEEFSLKILEYFDIKKYFDFVSGATMDLSRQKKGDIIAYAINALNITDKSQILMVGDKEHDIFGAKENGIKSAGVLYGYGDRAELTAAGADYIVDSLMEIAGI